MIEAAFYGTKGAATLRNVGGSSYVLIAERFDGTAAAQLTDVPDPWGGRAAARRAEQLARSPAFDLEAEQFFRSAEVLDRIYGR